MKKTVSKWMFFTLLLMVVASCALVLAGCAERPEVEQPAANQESESIQMQETDAMANVPGIHLTDEELVRFNEVFAAQAVKSDLLPVNGFFTSLYDDVTELDFVEFLRYYPSDGFLGTEDSAEFEALSKHPAFPWNADDFEKEFLTVNDLPTPTRRILRTSVDETLETYAGITTADLKNVEGVCYLAEYDAYYNFTSDVGPGLFECVGGKKDEDTVRLWSAVHGFDGSREILTLQEENGNYYIRSFQNVGGGE